VNTCKSKAGRPCPVKRKPTVPLPLSAPSGSWNSKCRDLWSCNSKLQSGSFQRADQGEIIVDGPCKRWCNTCGLINGRALYQGRSVKPPDTGCFTLESAKMAYLKLHQISICNLSKEGRIPSIRIGRVWRFDKDVIDAWIAGGQGEQNSAS